MLDQTYWEIGERHLQQAAGSPQQAAHSGQRCSPSSETLNLKTATGNRSGDISDSAPHFSAVHTSCIFTPRLSVSRVPSSAIEMFSGHRELRHSLSDFIKSTGHAKSTTGTMADFTGKEIVIDWISAQSVHSSGREDHWRLGGPATPHFTAMASAAQLCR
ncbi:unnamed protein product [Pleuronectes platessa]|uniref:Uncharacterized protein n=1 Tax=Pleuronectes platessa TaxID=8262 RepID=A0A9N7U0E1_PLEPL|nr:unnamed protein product [Pleuronectes platessa]